MNKNKLLLLITIVVIIVNVSIAQNLNLDYSDGSTTLPLDSTAVLSVDSITGDVTLSTEDSSEDIGAKLGLQPTGNPPGISFNVIANGTTSADINATIVNDAVYCNRTNLWSGLDTSNPPTTYVTSVSENVTANGNNYTLSCGNTFGVTTQNASVTNITTVLNPVVTISANPTTVSSGGSSVVTWSVTNSPDTCDFTGSAWPGGGGTNVIPANFPSSSFTVSNITSPQTLSVICDNSAAGNSGLQSVTINLTGSGTSWPTCGAPQTAILAGAEDRTILANGGSTSGLGPTNGTFNEFYGIGTPSSLPMSNFFGNNMELVLTRNEYIAGQFNSGSANLTAKFDFITPGGSQGPVPSGLTATISECPGDFNFHLGQTRCKAAGANSTLFWSDSASANPAVFCKLDKNKTYYLNIVHAFEGVNNYGTSQCGSAGCGILATPGNVNVE